MTSETTPTIHLVTFSQTSLNDYASSDVDDVLSKVDREKYTWIHVVNLHELAVTARILEHFGLPLSLAERIEDSLPMEFEADSESYFFKKFRLIALTAAPDTIVRELKQPSVLIRESETDRFEEVSGTIILGKTFLLLFEDQHSTDLVDNARTKILNRKTKVQQHGVDYLFFWLTRALLIENYFSLFRQFMDQVHDVEDALLKGATDAAVYLDVVNLRRELGPFERSLLYASDFAAVLIHEKPEVLSPAILSDFTEVLANETDRLEKEFSILRDRTSELIQIYRDNINTQLNNLMRIIAVISTIFLPLSFITGFYGMNFPNMPAFKWSGSFPIVVATMILLVIGGLIYARKKKWL